jgi:hypothetical protein
VRVLVVGGKQLDDAPGGSSSPQRFAAAALAVAGQLDQLRKISSITSW